jgi:glycosyltransferase involved in cell wall biosynthesis
MISLSVIIPTRNRAKYLEKALESISNQTLSQKFYEVIIVDNGSVDHTKDVVRIFEKKIENLVYLYDDTPGLHIGRHKGLLQAKADILVYADDDIIAFPTWLEGIMESFEDKDVVLVGGKVLPYYEIEPPKWIVDMWEKGKEIKIIPYLSLVDLGDKVLNVNPYYIFGCNFSIRKDILYKAGGFHPDGMPQELRLYRGDGETHVAKYILENGLKAVYNPKASVYHFVSKERVTKEYFIQRSFNQGISDSYFDIRNGKKRSLMKLRMKILIKKYLLRKDVSIETEYIKGYEYHQREAKRNPKLLEWIKRESYIYNGGIK